MIKDRDKLESTGVEITEKEGDDWMTEETEVVRGCQVAECSGSG